MNKFIKSICSIVMIATSVSFVSSAKAEEVYMIRGFLNVFSDGMNQMTSQLKRRGIRAKAMSAGSWESQTSDIIARAKRKQVSFPIIVAGHSLGGVDAVRFANKLGRAGVPVALVIGLDPGFPQPTAFTKGAKQVVNYVLPGGKRYRKGLGFKGTIRHINVAKYGTDHVGIDKNRQIQSLVISRIRKAAGK